MPKSPTQKERLLMMFAECDTWTNYQLRHMEPAMFQYPTRIFELSKLGYVFKTWFDADDPKKYNYKLIAKPDTQYSKLENGQYCFV